ncbi:hypothetical protein E4U41_005279, partial [Claviceps citrina]
PAVTPLPVQNTYAIPQPSYVPMPAPSQPVMVNGQAYVPAVPAVPAIPGQQPVMAAAAVPVEFAYSNRLFEPQEFKPADDDPSRFYYVREVDGNWTQRNRFTIDHMGDCRWYLTDEGWFYAVRLPD